MRLLTMVKKIARELYDAWRGKPPCEAGGECDPRCPYNHECYGDDGEEDDGMCL